MKDRTKKSDAVAKSCRWKEAVAKEAEGMTVEQTIANFDRAAVPQRFDAALSQAEQVGESGAERVSQ